MRWLYHCCHFAFGWLVSFLSWIGFSDDGTGETHWEPSFLSCLLFFSQTAPLFNMQHLCRGERSRMAVPWRMVAESGSNLGKGAFVTARLYTDVSIVHNVTPSFATMARGGLFLGECFIPFTFQWAPLSLSPCNKPTLGLLGSVTSAWQGAMQAIHSMFWALLWTSRTPVPPCDSLTWTQACHQT